MIAAKMDCLAGKMTRYVFAFILGWISCGVFYGTLSLTQRAKTLQVVQTQVVPKLQAKLGCEQWRAAVLEKQAKSPVVVDPSQIPKDCPPLKVPKAGN